MILGMTPLTFIHVVISLIGIAAGLGVLAAMLRSDRSDRLTAIFLAFTLATSLTGFLFPFVGLTPAFAVGVVAVLILIPTLAGRYAFRLAGVWRPIFVVGAVASQYLNVFVLVVQAFLKVPALNALAPNGNEPPFVAVQGVVLLLHLWIGYRALRTFHPAATGGLARAA